MKTSITCQNCGVKIPTRQIKRRQRLVKCARCQTTFSLTDESGEIPEESGFKQLTVPLPRGFKIETSENELKIIWSWFGSQHILSIIVVSFFAGGLIFLGYIIGLAETWQRTLVCLIPMSVGAAITFYLALATYINKTMIIITPTTLEIKRGPIPTPFWSDQQLDSSRIKQLYVAEKIQSGGSLTTYKYQLYAIINDRRETLLTEVPLTEWRQLLYLEQEIERYLGIKDRPVSEEPVSPSLNPLKGPKEAVWRALASANRLNFTARSLLKGAYISGLYRGCYLELDTLSKKRSDDANDIYTRRLLSVNQLAEADLEAKRVEPLTLAQVAHVLTPTGSLPRLKGTFTVEAGGQKIYYEQIGVEAEANYVQFLFDAFSDLLEAYPKIVTLGGETAPALQAIMEDENHPFQAVAPQLLAEVAQDTSQRLAAQAPRLRCSRCLGRCVAHEIRLSLLNPVAYYSCQSCRQSQEFLEFEGQIIAVLDGGMMTTPQSRQDQRLRVNWLARRTLFSFDAVEIIQASDEEVERFAVQVGNDTNPVRQARYKDLGCLVSAACELSENTMRILQRTFGSVEVQSGVQSGE